MGSKNCSRAMVRIMGKTNENTFEQKSVVLRYASRNSPCYTGSGHTNMLGASPTNIVLTCRPSGATDPLDPAKSITMVQT